MEASILLDAHVQAKRIYNLLNEVMDVSRQMAEAVDRDDQVAIQMLVSMREEPVRKLQRARRALEEQRNALEPETAQRLSRLLNGEAAETEAEAPLAAQVGANRRLLEQVLELDRVLNRKLTREESIYK
ncbi:hypothetical protein [Oscillibacter sp.]|jgi:hypothetical protein|uniref:hypothetical protein n=1 Tax=Oscillibacter sp. TaxID=1945593 RepID=UPI00217081FF|nr:hypothetical protein [Oscillibacter sp.]MCI9647885.1 hypothetical protein [Oscillibacter sp.]